MGITIWTPSPYWKQMKENEKKQTPTVKTKIRPLPNGQILMTCARCKSGSIVEKQELLDKLITCPNCQLQVRVSKMPADIENYLKQRGGKKVEIHIPGLGTRLVDS